MRPSRSPRGKAPRWLGLRAETNIATGTCRFDVTPPGKAKTKLMTRQRILLVVLLAWALVMIVPDLLRVATPLGSFGFYADNDGLIYDVVGSPITHPQITQRIRWYSSGGFRRVRSSRIARPQTATAKPTRTARRVPVSVRYPLRLP